MPNYLELSVPDIDASKAFYAKAFDFAFVNYGPEYQGVSGDHIEIGLFRSNAPPPPLPGFQTDDIDAALKTVREAGGEIVRETYEFPGGRRFHFRDPGGNEMLVYQYETQE
ncbi:MAG: VOC family protein [Sphingomonadaceae bacterium]|nr:VOC family protein [Sphingomonadaceae bacterium]RZV46034.1 MAG: VOC family protein [Sphingomonadaceae bacterium]